MSTRRLNVAALLALLVLLAGCSTPFKPPAVVKESSNFSGLVKLLNEISGQPLDVVLVHDMYTTNASWPISVMLNISSEVVAKASITPVKAEVAKALANENQVVPGL